MQMVDKSTFGSVMGQATWLLTMDKTYRDRPIKDIETIVSAPLLLGQIKIFQKAGQPVAYLSFAMVTPELKARIEAGYRPASVEEWRCGSNMSVVDVVSPFNDPGVFVEQFYQSLNKKSAQ